MAAFDPEAFLMQSTLKAILIPTFESIMETGGLPPDEAAALTLDILEESMRQAGTPFMPRLCALWLEKHIKETMG